MKKIVILYYSQHHGNTKKILDAIKEKNEVDIFPIEDQSKLDLQMYDKVGFASGIYMSKMHDKLSKYVEENLGVLQGKDCFVLATGGANNQKGINNFVSMLKGKNISVLGEYYCKGYDTYGPFKLLGGINKNHPTQKECNEAVAFYNGISGD